MILFQGVEILALQKFELFKPKINKSETAYYVKYDECILY